VAFQGILHQHDVWHKAAKLTKAIAKVRGMNRRKRT